MLYHYRDFCFPIPYEQLCSFIMPSSHDVDLATASQKICIGDLVRRILSEWTTTRQGRISSLSPVKFDWNSGIMIQLRTIPPRSLASQVVRLSMGWEGMSFVPLHVVAKLAWNTRITSNRCA